MKKTLGICLALVMMISVFSQAAFAASTPEGYVTFTRNGNVYLDMTTTQSLGTSSYVLDDSITVGASETIDITLKQNAMFYNNSSTFAFLGYKLQTTNNNSNGNVLITLTEGSTAFHTVTVLKTTFASAVNNIYVTGDTTINITLSPTTISATVTGSKGTVTLFENIALPNARINTGGVAFKTNSGSATYRKLKTVNISSGSADVTKSSFFMNKNFSSSDSKTDLEADGYTLSGVDTYSNSVGLARHSSSGAMSVMYTGATFSGAYTLEIEAAKAHNNGYVYFNYADSDNYYRIATKSTGSSSGTLWIQKMVGGTITSLLTDAEGNTVESQSISMGTNNDMKYVVSLLPDSETGDLKITATLRNSANVSKTFTVTDKKTDTYSPMLSGGVGYGNSYVNVASSKVNFIKSIKVYPGEIAPAVSGVFKNNGVETDEYRAGVTTFGFPVAMIGESTELIAALYNGEKLVSVKSLDLTRVNSDDVLLFSESGNKVKVFTWDSLSGVKPLDFVYQLPTEKTLKILTYNVKHCENQLTNEVDYNAVADAIKSMQPDIVGLNEINDEGTGLEFDAQTEILSKLTGLKHHFFGQATTKTGGPYGNGFLSKYPIKNIEVIPIPDPEEKTGTALYETRSIIKAKLSNGLTVMVMHFGLNQDEKENAFATLLANLPTEKCIVMGDFNIIPDNELLDQLDGKLVDVATITDDDLFTHKADNPDKKIDYIFVTPDIEIISAEVPNIVTSDHRPLTAVVNIGE